VGVLQVMSVVVEKKLTTRQEENLIRSCHVQVEKNMQTIFVLVDSGATRNFVKEEVIIMLGLKIEPTQSSFKAVNSEVERVVGMLMWSLQKLVDGVEL
jgi:hypothetical protein